MSTTIVNPTPLTGLTFGGYWITSVNLSLPTGKPGYLTAQFQPYDGSANILATGGKSIAIRNPSSNSAAAALIASLQSEVTRQSGNGGPFVYLQINGPDPSKPVRAQALYTNGTPAPFVLPDLFAKAASDSTFASVLTAALASLATLAGTSVEG